jgi:hypothetical protein
MFPPRGFRKAAGQVTDPTTPPPTKHRASDSHRQSLNSITLPSPRHFRARAVAAPVQQPAHVQNASCAPLQEGRWR